MKSEIDKSSFKTKTSMMLGQWLIQKGMITEKQLEEALSHQQETGSRLGESLIKLDILGDVKVTQALSQYLKVDYYPLTDLTKINMIVARSIPENIARRLDLVAIGEKDNRVVIAMSDPLNVVAIDTVTVKIKRLVRVVISPMKKIRQAIDTIYHGSSAEEERLRDLVSHEDFEKDNDPSRINVIVEDDTPGADIGRESDANQAPVVRFVDLLLSQAVKSKASDIHIEPQEKSLIIRMRVDGCLQEMISPPRKMQASAVTRIKILAQMDIAERRLPQDGRFKIQASQRDIDIRVSSIPTIYGEKIVMRILDKSTVNHNIESLDFGPKNLEIFKGVLRQPHGIVIVTGPTGSGKSTTLYSALHFLKDPKKNIVTVEDPVEYRLSGINQVQVKSDIDLDFSTCLRAILRQDPDIIMIGEIRDKETVEIAMKASLTGHMVLSTFHTNDAPSAITRLIHMGIQPYLLASTLNLILAQRLIRKNCEHCKQLTSLDAGLLKKLRIPEKMARPTPFSKGKGCSHSSPFKSCRHRLCFQKA
ncbi:MAG: Flp pilus assembly complex ATPase component TadA [Planctomycetes bacterium]|nr:Flp pilus assembly complex ATPase component TadA [Planctomycetota bacterium]